MTYSLTRRAILFTHGRTVSMTKKVLIEDWVLHMLWRDFRKGAAKNELNGYEMRGHINRWKKDRDWYDYDN